MYANEVETGKIKTTWDKKLTTTYTCQDHMLESLFGFFRCDTWLQIFQNDSKICEAEVTLTPLINKICKPWGSFDYQNVLKL